nr:MetQ/NlpA family ABC transporter substrate-binding protein [Acholeplasma hippikon]
MKDDLKADGIKVEAVQMNYNSLNTPLNNDEIDGNLIQHQYFMQVFNDANKGDLVIAQPVYHSKFAIFSEKYETINDIPNGETIYLPLDTVNLSRALILLETAGLITLKDGIVKTSSTLDDIAANPKNLVWDQSAINVTPAKYRDSGRGLAIMYPSYVISSLGSYDEGEIYMNEPLNDLTKTYAISFVVKASRLNDDDIQTFIKHLTSDKVRQWIIDQYGFAAIPAF